MSLHSRQLSPLYVKTNAVLGGDAFIEEISPSDVKESRPLLPKEQTCLHMSTNNSRLFNTVPELFSHRYYPLEEPKEHTRDKNQLDYHTFNQPARAQNETPRTEHVPVETTNIIFPDTPTPQVTTTTTTNVSSPDIPTLHVTTTQMFPHFQTLPTDRLEESTCGDKVNSLEVSGDKENSADLQELGKDTYSSPTKEEEQLFELQVENTKHDDSRRACAYRPMSSSESSPHVQGCYEKEAEHDPVQTWGDHYKRVALSRSQTHPLTTEEEEYSQYWRGQVTVIKTPEAVLPNLKPQSSLELDEPMTCSPITKAILKGDHQMVLESLKQGWANPHQICSKTHKSYLHVVASSATADQELKWVPMVYQFSNCGVDIDLKDKDGRSAVRISIIRRLIQILAALLKCGAEVDLGDEYHAEQARGVIKSEMLEVMRRLTPSYWSTVHDPTHFKIARLMKSWCRINVSRKGQTLIEYAKQHAKDDAVVKLLLQQEASIELAHAVMAGDADRARMLLCDCAVDVTTSDMSVKSHVFDSFSPLTLVGAAVKYGHQEVLQVLQELPKSTLLKSGRDAKEGPGFPKSKSGYDVKEGSYMAHDSARAAYRRSEQDSSLSKPLLSNAVHYGSSNLDVNSTGPVTSVLCALL